jgi:hypothetical protein
VCKGAHRQVEDRDFERTGALVIENHETPKNPKLSSGNVTGT